LKKNLIPVKINSSAFFCAMIIIIIASCSAGKKTIISEVEWQKEIDSKTSSIVSEELSLSDCIEIALKNNLENKKIEIQEKISKLDKKIAFSNFMPQVNLNFSYRDWRRQPEALTGPGAYRITQDKSFGEQAVEIQFPVFAPSTWFIYSANKRGENINGLLKEHIKQGLTLQTVVLYYKCLFIEESENYILSQINAAKSLFNEFEIKQKEGLLLDWQVEELKVYLMSYYNELNKLIRNRKTAGAELLKHLGLSPLNEIKLKKSVIDSIPPEKIDELILYGILNNPQLKISIEKIKVSQDKAKIAVSNFLPVLMSFANFSHTNNDYTKYANQTILGLSGVMTAFNGFKNVFEYRKARLEEENEFLKREETILSVMLNIFNSYNNLKDADDFLNLSKMNLEVEKKRLNNIKEKNNEGLAGTTELLEATARFDSAKSSLFKAGFNYQIAAAALYNSISKNFSVATEAK